MGFLKTHIQKGNKKCQDMLPQKCKATEYLDAKNEEKKIIKLYIDKGYKISTTHFMFATDKSMTIESQAKEEEKESPHQIQALSIC